MWLNNKFGTHVNLFTLYRYEAILLFWIHLPEEVWQVVMAKMGEIQNYCFDKESNISLQWCGCSFRVFLDYWCFEKVQSHSQLNKKGLSFKPSLNTQSCNRGLLLVRDFCFGPFRQPGQDKKKGLGRTKKLYKMKLNIILWYFLFFDPEKIFFFQG